MVRVILFIYVLSPAALYAWLTFGDSAMPLLPPGVLVNFAPFTVFFFLWLVAIPFVAALCGLIEVVGRAFYE